MSDRLNEIKAKYLTGSMVIRVSDFEWMVKELERLGRDVAHRAIRPGTGVGMELRCPGCNLLYSEMQPLHYMNCSGRPA